MEKKLEDIDLQKYYRLLSIFYSKFKQWSSTLESREIIKELCKEMKNIDKTAIFAKKGFIKK